MNDKNIVTFNGKEVKFEDLPPEFQKLTQDSNANGLPDSLEPLIDMAKTSGQNITITSSSGSSTTQPSGQAIPTDVFVDSQIANDLKASGIQIIKSFILSSKYYIIASTFIALLLIAMMYMIQNI